MEIFYTDNLSYFDNFLGTLISANLDIFGIGVFSYAGTNITSEADNAQLIASSVLKLTSSLGVLSLLINNMSLISSSGVLRCAAGKTKNFGTYTELQSQSINLGA